jgi:hypothetical protein
MATPCHTPMAMVQRVESDAQTSPRLKLVKKESNFDSGAYFIGVRRGVSNGVEESHRPPALQVGHTRGRATPAGGPPLPQGRFGGSPPAAHCPRRRRVRHNGQILYFS